MKLGDIPFFPFHFDDLIIEMNLTVVHDQLRGLWGGSGLVGEVFNVYIVD